jgi:hypothetical protein
MAVTSVDKPKNAGALREEAKGREMPARFIDDSLDAETVKAVMVAFEEARKALGLVDKDDAITDYLAKQVVQLAKQGERDPVRLRDLTLKSLKN